MTIGSGLGGFVGIAPETTYGTYVAPTRFHQMSKVDLKKVKTTVQGGGLAGGALVQPGSRRVVTTRAAAGGLDVEVVNTQMGLLLNHLMGGTVTPAQQAATTAYLQTHALADNIGKSLSVQVGIPDRSGTIRPYSYTGVKVLAGEFSCGVDNLLTSSFTLDGMDVSEVQAAASPAYPAGQAPRHFGEMSVLLGTFGAEAAVTGVKKVDVKIERPQDTSSFYANGLGTKAEPIMNDFVKITGSIDVDFANKADFADRFASDASTSMILQWQGPIIASTYHQLFSVAVPMTFFDTDSPTLTSNGGVVSTTYNFVGEYDGTHPPATISYMSTDTVL